jgi:CRP/FNR family transcriptional regulator, cyclic AMP receptor protein
LGFFGHVLYRRPTYACFLTNGAFLRIRHVETDGGEHRMGKEMDRSKMDDWVEQHGWICSGSDVFLRYQREKVDVLQKVPLFGGLSLRDLNNIARYAGEKRVKTGAMLARQGRRERDFMLILDGSARVERDGKVLAQLKAGDFFGEMALIDGEPRSATVFAESPCVLLVIGRRSFQQLLDSVPGMQKKILITLCQRLRAADAALAAFNL